MILNSNVYGKYQKLAQFIEIIISRRKARSKFIKACPPEGDTKLKYLLDTYRHLKRPLYIKNIVSLVPLKPYHKYK